MSAVDRQVPDDERRLWTEVRRRADGDTTRAVRVAHVATQLGIHEQRARQHARTWANDGLVATFRGANLVRLTDKGVNTTDLQP